MFALFITIAYTMVKTIVDTMAYTIVQTIVDTIVQTISTRPSIPQNCVVFRIVAN